jgi:hypothetical protein
VDDDEKRGAILAFRMEDCEDDTLTVTLPFVDGIWKLTDEDTGDTWTTDGTLTLTFAEKRSARLIWVEKE